MLSKAFKFIVFATVIMMCLILEANGQMSMTDKNSLQGITRLIVVVENIEPEIERDVIERSTIQTDVELKLRMAGVKVINSFDNNSLEGPHYIYVNINILKIDEFQYVYNINVKLIQGVMLIRNDELCLATTWSDTYLGFAGTLKQESIRDSIKELVDNFIIDYLDMNQ